MKRSLLQKLLGAFARHPKGVVDANHDQGAKAMLQSGRKQSKKTWSPFRSRRARFDDGVVQIGVELENGRRLYYMVHGEAGVERLDEEKTNRIPLVSAYSNDFRIFTQGPMSDAKAKGFAARESDALERMAVINESKRGRIYATTHSSIDAETNRVPLLAVIDELLADRKGSFVAGVMLGKQDVVILYAFNEGLMGSRQLQIAINPGNLDAIVHSFVSMSGLPDEAEVVIFEQEELLQKLSERSWAPYPSTQGFYGIPARHIPTLMVGAAGAAAIAASGYAAYWYMQERQYINLTKEHIQKKEQTIAEVGNEIMSRRQDFMLKTSVDFGHAAKLAAELRTDGALVEAVLKRDSYSYTVITPFFSPDSTGDGEAYKTAIALEPKNGCTKRDIETTGGMREIKVQYACANPGASFSRFGW